MADAEFYDPSIGSQAPVAVTDYCQGCFAGGAYSIISDPASTVKSFTPYIVYTAYSVISAILSDGLCSTESGPPVTRSGSYSVVVPSSMNPSSYLPAADQQFVTFLGLTGCNAESASAKSKALPTALVTSAGQVSSLPVPSMNATEPSYIVTLVLLSGTTSSLATSTRSGSSTVGAGSATAAPNSTSSAAVTSSNELNISSRIAIGVIIPIACIALAAAAALMLIRYRNRKRQAVLSGKNGDSAAEKTDSTLPYLQNKVELADEERRKHELEAKSINYEMGAEGAIHEAPTGRQFGIMKAQNQQELRGEEFSKEVAADDADNVGRGR